MAGAVETITLNVPDISCGHCVAKVNKAVSELVGVSGVNASAATKTVAVSYDPHCVSAEDIAARMKDAGYPISDKPARISTLPMVS
jgi:copper chaperone